MKKQIALLGLVLISLTHAPLQAKAKQVVPEGAVAQNWDQWLTNHRDLVNGTPALTGSTLNQVTQMISHLKFYINDFKQRYDRNNSMSDLGLKRTLTLKKKFKDPARAWRFYSVFKVYNDAFDKMLGLSQLQHKTHLATASFPVLYSRIFLKLEPIIKRSLKRDSDKSYWKKLSDKLKVKYKKATGAS